MEKLEIEDNGKEGRVVLYNEGREAGEMTFIWEEVNKLKIEHTEVGKEYGGKGYGKKLLNRAVEYAREKEIKILPICPFAKALMEKDQSLQDVLV